jgi:hypothetical protein
MATEIELAVAADSQKFRPANNPNPQAAIAA